MKMTKEEFIAKYPKPVLCPISIEEWCTSLGYCWSYASDIDNGVKFDEKAHCPCEFFK